MKSFLKSLKRQDGFTLVELMVVVAIIGLLSAVAIPNFKKYQAKAKMSEGKLHLSSIYTAETAFFSDYNIYGTCLIYMGYNPAAEAASRYYATGFNVTQTIEPGAYGAAQNSGLSSAAGDCPNNEGAMALRSWFTAGKGSGAVFANLATFIDNTAFGNQNNGAMTFVAGAAGVIDPAFITEANSSLITVNEIKVFSNVRNGY
ncbi:MAG TPA: prepilin-type N-terminal cleavage/methylation domain-containing protein [Bacteriovoracaceae bacterium]|nr:prepilin-type N-terminal cleavage/methylation domain-containing protein [Bacteriovoracaceae bacterium]